MSSRVSNHVTASRGSSVSSDLPGGSRRSRPIGASIRPLRERGRPRTSARYRRSTSRARIAAWSAGMRSSERATTSSPDVSRSSRWTIPGRSGSSPPAAPSASSCAASVPAEAPAPGCTVMPAGLSTTTRCSSSYAMRTVTGSGSSAPRRARKRDLDDRPCLEAMALRPRSAPSTVTAPSRTSRSASDRVPISSRSASARSRRDPACVSATLKRRVATRAIRACGAADRRERARRRGSRRRRR